MKIKSKPITVNVSEDIYQKLCNYQKELRLKDGKKTALSDILANLALHGIEELENAQSESHPTQKSDANTQNDSLVSIVMSKKRSDTIENFGDFSKMTRKKLEYLDELEERYHEKEWQLESQRYEFQKEREMYLRNREDELSTKQCQIEREHIETVGSIFHVPGVSNSQADKPFLSENFVMLKSIIQDFRAEFREYKDTERQAHKKTIESMQQYAQNIEYQLKYSSKPAVDFMQYVPWIAMVAIPLLMKLLSSDEDKSMLRNLQSDLSDLTKNQKKEDTDLQ